MRRPDGVDPELVWVNGPPVEFEGRLVFETG